MKHLALLSPIFLAASASLSLGAAVIYEPFDYGTGNFNGTQGGALGTAGNWTQSGGSGLFSAQSGLSFTGLSTTGRSAQRTSAPGGSEMSIGVSTTAQTALLNNGSTIYFSLLLRNDRFSVGNEGMTFVIGTDAFDVISPDNVNPTITGGEGFGVHMDGLGDGTIDIFGYSIDGGTAAESVGKVDNDTSVNTFMIVGQIDWVANGGNDTLTLYNVADPTAGLGSSFATMTADLDQAAFDTLAITNRQVSTIDEIRFGTSLGDVGVIPEPSVFALVGLGGVVLLRRRR